MKSRTEFAAARKALSLVLGAGILIGCGRAAQKPADRPEPPSVTVTQAAIGTLTPTRTLAGTIAPLQNILLSNLLNEPAAEVPVSEGDHVARGEVLARFDVSDLVANLRNAEANVLIAQSNAVRQRASGEQVVRQSANNEKSARAAVVQARERLRLDELTLGRNEELLRQSFVPQQTVDTARTTVETDRAALRSAEANLAAAEAVVATNGGYRASNAAPNADDGIQAATLRTQLAQIAAARAQAEQLRVQIARGVMRSPVDGVVVNRNLNPGEYPNGRTLFILQETGAVYAILGASAAQLRGVRENAAARVVPSGRNAALDGRVVAILGQTTPGATNFTIKLLLQNPRGDLLSGLPVRATIALGTARGVVVPQTAFLDATHTQVLTVRDGKIARRTVASVAEDERRAVVTGLSAGSAVVADGDAGLVDGQAVRARKAAR